MTFIVIQKQVRSTNIGTPDLFSTVLIYFSMRMVMEPVSVLILHSPPNAYSGTSTLPVPDFALKIFSESSVSLMDPVSVSMSSSAASQRSRLMLPVSDSSFILSRVVTFVSVIRPVSVFTRMSLDTLIAETLTAPVSDSRFRFSGLLPEQLIRPVSVLIFRVF